MQLYVVWVCGESWIAIKDSLIHHPSSQGWEPTVLLLCCSVCVCVCVCGVGGGGGGGGRGGSDILS